MPTFHLITFGCKVNQCDSAGMAVELARQGWSPVPPGVIPDLTLVNTCTVTARADQQARQALRRLAREHPALPVWVTGCYAQRAPMEVAALPGVQAVFGNREKAGLGRLLEETGAGRTPRLEVGSYDGGEPFHFWGVQSFPGHTRAWIKIQEGCSHHCRYCIVPTVRGARRSLAPETVKEALQEAAAAGYREVVLTGIDLGQYGQDQQPASSLAHLVRRLRERPYPLRVRLSSLEPQEVTCQLLAELAAWPEFCSHFHLPLQSGAGDVLAAMGRPHTPGHFQDLVHTIRRLFPEAALGLDVLVGFPGEKAEDFTATWKLIRSLPVTYLHVFPFSPRPGTSAAALPALPGKEVHRRARLLRHLGREKKLAFLQAQLGRTRPVLVEGIDATPGWVQGLSDNYLRVALPGPPAWRNHLVRVHFREIMGDKLLGEAVAG